MSMPGEILQIERRGKRRAGHHFEVIGRTGRNRQRKGQRHSHNARWSPKPITSLANPGDQHGMTPTLSGLP
jgi:hypothetical protein